MRALLQLVSLGSLVGAAVIVPGAPWTDIAGNRIQAHGAGILKVGSTFYWFGEDKAHNSGLFRAVSCYTSTDLTTWTRQNDALSPQAGTSISTSNIVERPKVVFNQNNQEYVMWFHSDSSNYGAAQVGVATAKSPCGPYTYKSSFKPLGADSRDMGLFQDTDQSTYLLYASDNNQNFKIAHLDANFYNVTTVASTLPGSTLESPGIVKRNNVYYLFASHTTGWAPNPNKFFTASSLNGPWSSQADIAPSNTRTYYSQNAYDLQLSTNSAIYMGDRWRSNVLGDSRYIWLPLDFSSGTPKLVWADVWTVNVAAGTYSVASGTAYEAEKGTRGGNSTLISNSAFSGGQAVGYLGNGGTVTISNVQGTGVSGGQWVSVYFANGDSSYRNMTITVNGGSQVTLDQPDSGGGNVVLSVPVRLPLRSGANTLVFASSQNNYAADLDKIVVYTQT
ncbi:galactan 1,3-beta-galactosidase [Auricularia subglabra TFB-10046 SS5]|nr:galactan 1,3-beta-galactosidase [Auricularia subglabra TFB-10046 SS5]